MAIPYTCSLNAEVIAFMVRRPKWKAIVIFLALTALGDRYKQSKIRYHPLSSWASFEVRLKVLKPACAQRV